MPKLCKRHSEKISSQNQKKNTEHEIGLSTEHQNLIAWIQKKEPTFSYIHTHICMCVCMCKYRYVCIHTYTVYTYVCIYIYKHVYIYTHMYIYICMSTYVCVCVYNIYKYVCTYMYVCVSFKFWYQNIEKLPPNRMRRALTIRSVLMRNVKESWWHAIARFFVMICQKHMMTASTNTNATPL